MASYQVCLSTTYEKQTGLHTTPRLARVHSRCEKLTVKNTEAEAKAQPRNELVNHCVALFTYRTFTDPPMFVCWDEVEFDESDESDTDSETSTVEQDYVVP